MDNTYGHICFDCHNEFNQTKENPSRTDFCAKCGHRGEGINRKIHKSLFNIILIGESGGKRCQ